MISLYTAATALLVAQTFGFAGYACWAGVYGVAAFRSGQRRATRPQGEATTPTEGMGSSAC